jgi:hypothetical protein
MYKRIIIQILSLTSLHINSLDTFPPHNPIHNYFTTTSSWQNGFVERYVHRM